MHWTVTRPPLIDVQVEGEIEKGRAAAKVQLAAGNRDRAALLLAVVKAQRASLLQIEQSKLKVRGSTATVTADLACCRQHMFLTIESLGLIRDGLVPLASGRGAVAGHRGGPPHPRLRPAGRGGERGAPRRAERGYGGPRAADPGGGRGHTGANGEGEAPAFVLVLEAAEYERIYLASHIHNKHISCAALSPVLP